MAVPPDLKSAHDTGLIDPPELVRPNEETNPALSAEAQQNGKDLCHSLSRFSFRIDGTFQAGIAFGICVERRIKPSTYILGEAAKARSLEEAVRLTHDWIRAQRSSGTPNARGQQ